MLNNQDFTVNRTKYLGGSDLGAILGFSKYRSALDVWLEKTGKASNTATSLPLRFGSFAEEFVASEYATQTGFTLINHPNTVVHPEFPYLAGHIDRYVAGFTLNKPLFNKDGTCNATRLLECKTANPFTQSDWGELGTDEVPMSYLVQCLWYLALTKVNQCDVAVLFGNSDFRIYEIYSDPELENLLTSKAQEFWISHVQADIPPPPQTEHDCQQLFRNEKIGQSIEADELTREFTQKLKLLNQEIKSIELEASQIKQTLMEKIGEAQTLTYRGQVLATWKAPKPSFRLDSKRLEIEHPDLIPRYQVPIQNSRRLVIKDILSQT